MFDPTASALTQLFFCYEVHGKTAAAVSPGSTWRTESARFVIRITRATHVPKMLTARYVQSSAVATKCVGSGSLFFRIVCCFVLLGLRLF